MPLRNHTKIAIASVLVLTACTLEPSGTRSGDTDELPDLSEGLMALDTAFDAFGLERESSEEAVRSDARSPSVVSDQIDELRKHIPSGLTPFEGKVTIALTAQTDKGKGIAWKIIDFSKKTKTVQHHSIVLTYRRPGTPSDE